MALKNLTAGQSWADIWKVQRPDGTMDNIVNEMVENNLILQHAVWLKANNGNTHQGTRVASLPSSSPKRMNEGTAPSAGSHVNYVEETQVRETWLQIEDEVLQKSANPARYLDIMAMRAVQGIIQDSIQDMLYGNRGVSPDLVNGLHLRYNAIQTNRQLGRVVSAGGAGGTNTSLWGVKWGEDGVFLIYPEDHPDAGVKSEVFGPENVTDSSGKIMRVYRIRVQFAFGIAVANRRAIFRVANIDSAITPANWILNVENTLMSVTNDCLDDGKGYRVYANNFAKTQFDIRAKDKGNVWFSPSDPISQTPGNVCMFNQTPIYKLERLIQTEPTLT